MVSVPIVSGDRVFGALSVFSLTEERGFSDRDLALVAGVGRQAGIAMENARLYEEQRAIAAELRASEERLRFYVTQITRAQEDERERIAWELHDETAQALVALSRRLDALLTSPQRLAEPAMERLDELRQMTEGILQGVRHFSQDLRPPTLDDLGLLPTLEGLITDLMEQEGIEAELRVVGAQRRLPPEAELVLFRIAQEALNNVKKHSTASKVVTTVEFTNGQVRITVSDNGQGFDLPTRTGDLAATGKLGLIGMQERAQLLVAPWWCNLNWARERLWWWTCQRSVVNHGMKNRPGNTGSLACFHLVSFTAFRALVTTSAPPSPPPSLLGFPPGILSLSSSPSET